MSVALPPAKRPRSDSGDGTPGLSPHYAQHPQVPHMPHMAQMPQMHYYSQIPQVYYSQLPQMYHPQMQPPSQQSGQQPLPPLNWQIHLGAPGMQMGSMPPPPQPQTQLFPDPRRKQRVEDQLDLISAETLRRIVIDAAVADANSALSQALAAESGKILERRRNEVLNFDGYSKAAWHELNTKYSGLRASKQYDAAFDAQSAVGAMIDEILDDSDGTTSYGTRKSAVETIRKILKSVCLADDVVGSEVRKSCYGWDEKFVEALESFDSVELEQLVEEDGGQFVGKVRELVALADGYCIMEKLKDGLAILEGEDEDEEEEADEDDGDDSGEADGLDAAPREGKDQ